jgi:hypothetical protein
MEHGGQPAVDTRGLGTVRRLTAEVRTNKAMRREAYSMSLYVSIILLSALSVFDENHPPAEGQVFLLEAGTTLGLVLAHGFASWVSTRIIGDTEEEVPPADLLLVQIGGATVVAVLAMIAVVLAPVSVELLAARLTVSVAIAGQVYLESRSSSSPLKAGAYGILALVAAVTVAAVKSFLVH